MLSFGYEVVHYQKELYVFIFRTYYVLERVNFILYPVGTYAPLPPQSWSSLKFWNHGSFNGFNESRADRAAQCKLEIKPLNYLRIWNTTNMKQLHFIDTGSQVSSIVWNSEYRELISGHGFSQNQLTIWKYPRLSKVLLTIQGHMIPVSRDILV